MGILEWAIISQPPATHPRIGKESMMILLHVVLAWSLFVAVLYIGHRTARKSAEPVKPAPVVYGADNTWTADYDNLSAGS